jgi:hypothetical protein
MASSYSAETWAFRSGFSVRGQKSGPKNLPRFIAKTLGGIKTKEEL